MRDNLRTVREEMLREREELRARAQALERTQQAEGQWRSKVVKMQEEQEAKIKDLLGEIKRLKEREEEMEKWLSRLEVKTEVEESQDELFSTISSSTGVTFKAAMLEKQKTQISSLAAEVVTEQEVVDRQKNRETGDKKAESGGEVSRRGISFNRHN